MKLAPMLVAVVIILGTTCSAQDEKSNEPATDPVKRLAESERSWLLSANESDAAEWRAAKKTNSAARSAFEKQDLSLIHI